MEEEENDDILVSEVKNDTQDDQKNLKIKRNVFLITILLVLIGTTITIIIALKDNNDYYDPELYNFSCFSDSGSSSSKVHVYVWPKANDGFNPDVKELYYFQQKPALSKLGNDSEIENHINTILNGCEKQINYFTGYKADFSKITFFLRATAGMRSLTIERQNEIMNKVRDLAKKSKYLFDDEAAKVIKGTDEGLFGWITINYKKNTIQDNDKKKNNTGNTFGALDLGGSSMEISFETNDTTNSTTVKFGNLEYNIYSVVFDHYGQNDMFSNLLKHFIEKDKSAKTINNPCFLKEYTYDYTYNSNNYTFTGTGNFEECSAVMKELIIKKDCPDGKCFMDGQYKPVMDSNQKYIAFSGFSYVAEFFGLNKVDYYSAKDVYNHTKEFCELKWNDAVEKYKDTSEEYLRVYCYVGNYLYRVFTDGFGFEEDNKKIIFTNDINGETVSWALGAMIYEIITMN